MVDPVLTASSTIKTFLPKISPTKFESTNKSFEKSDVARDVQGQPSPLYTSTFLNIQMGYI